MSNVVPLKKSAADAGPTIVKPTARVRGRPKNADVRSREYLTAAEVDKLVAAASKFGRHCERDALLIGMCFRHGLRVSELTGLTWSQVDLDGGVLHVRRVKGGSPSTHPLDGNHIRTLRRLKRTQTKGGGFVFTTELGGPMSPQAVQKIVARAGVLAGFAEPIHPHQLRHACGYALANAGHDTRAIQLYLGHRNIQHTVRYTELASDRFKDFWKD
jgi:type 1 fimbriae regulatory protein FimB/type 1 fimbriae regulatory protein FimE